MLRVEKPLAGIGLLLAPTMRSRAYAQMLASRGMKPDHVFLFPSQEAQWSGPDEVTVPLDDKGRVFEFRPGEPASVTVEEMEWPSTTLPNTNINDPVVQRILGDSNLSVLVYSGMNKAIVTAETLAGCPRFLHVHGGYLPDYRAATGFYFGLLETGRIGVSAIWLDEGFDTGDLVGRAWYPNGNGLSVDAVVDPVARADLLANEFDAWIVNGAFPAIPQTGEAENYFVIHPVLKHLALRRTSAVNIAG